MNSYEPIILKNEQTEIRSDYFLVNLYYKSKTFLILEASLCIHLFCNMNDQLNTTFDFQLINLKVFKT
jgi:hypothetical protein